MNVCERVCACLSSCLPKRVCACTLSVWNVAAAVYFFERSCVPSSGAGVAVMSAQQRTSDETNASGRPSGVAGTRSDMRGHTQGLHTAHLSISRPSTGQSKLSFHPSGHVTVSLSSRTIERTCVHPYAHGNADKWTHVLIPLCIMCVPEHKGACI